jgi:biopolymer transport protein ExbB
LPNRSLIFSIAVMILALTVALESPARAQNSPAPQPAGAQPAGARPAETQPPGAMGTESGAEEDSRHSIWEIILSGGWTGLAIMLTLAGLSIIAVALIVEHLMTIRENVLMPPEMADNVRKELVSGNLVAAGAACREPPSFLGFVLTAGLAEADGGWPAVEKAMEDATAERAARLFRKIEYLSVIGNIAPMIGLLGTVTGMIFAFQEVASTQGAARASQLAEGIYQALVTTVGGLVIAIPALASFAIFRNRVDHLVAETAYVAQQVTQPLKRARAAKPRPVATPPPPPVEGRR